MAIEDDVLDLLSQANPFIDGPGDYLAKHTVNQFQLVTQFQQVFKDSMHAYMREDYGARELPALRIYNLKMRKEHASHYINGDITIDIIFPPSVRREEQQLLQDVVSSAVLQQLRRSTFFATMRNLVPGLNEYGKTVDIDKTLGFQWQNQIVPLTQIVANFRLDLKEWDEYLERENRTKDDPFEETLDTLEQIVSTIEGRVEGEDDPNVEVPIDQEVG